MNNSIFQMVTPCLPCSNALCSRLATSRCIAGDGPLRAELESLAHTLAPGKVTFHGRLSGSDVAALVHGSLAMAVPSRWFENQPMTILEAFAASVPPIVTALGGMPELVEDGVQGLVVPHDDPAALAEAIGYRKFHLFAACIDAASCSAKTNPQYIIVAAVPGEILDGERQLSQAVHAQELSIGPHPENIGRRVGYYFPY